MQIFENLNLLKSAYTVCVKPVCRQFGLTQMEFDVLMFLANNSEYDTASDIVRLRRFTKSHVSAALKSLAAREMLETFYREGNRKSIHLRLLPSSGPVVEEGRAAQEQFGKILFADFSQSEFALTQLIFQRICAHAREVVQEGLPCSS